MKKITLINGFMLAVAVGFFGTASLNAQNLITTNPGFEEWVDGAPTGYTLTVVTGSTITQESSIKSEGNSSLKINHAGTSGTGKIVYTTKVPVEAGKYTFSFKYYVDPTSGTTSVLRHWGYLNDVNGVQIATTDPNKALYDAFNKQLQYDGASTGYTATTTTGQWLTDNVPLDIPFAGTLQLEIRYYKTFVGYIDNISLVKNSSTGINSEKAVNNIYANNEKIYVPARSGQKIVVTNSLGQVLSVSSATDGMNELANLPLKQLLIVKVGSKVAKVIL
jgi:hypothetical protein